MYNLIKIIQNLQVCYLKFHAMNDDKDLVLLENCHSWRETLSSKFVDLDNLDKIIIALPYLIIILGALMPDISTLITYIHIYIIYIIYIYKYQDRAFALLFSSEFTFGLQSIFLG